MWKCPNLYIENERLVFNAKSAAICCEWVSGLNEQFVSYIMARTRYIRWDYDDISFVKDQQSAGRRTCRSTSSHYPVFRANEFSSFLINCCVFITEAVNTNLTGIGFDRSGLEHTIYLLETSLLTVSSAMR
jgi:hypothetical protein